MPTNGTDRSTASITNRRVYFVPGVKNYLCPRPRTPFIWVVFQESLSMLRVITLISLFWNILSWWSTSHLSLRWAFQISQLIITLDIPEIPTGSCRSSPGSKMLWRQSKKWLWRNCSVVRCMCIFQLLHFPFSELYTLNCGLSGGLIGPQKLFKFKFITLESGYSKYEDPRKLQSFKWM